MAASEIEPAPAAASIGQPGHAAAGGPAEPSSAPQVQQRSLLQRAFREGVVITVLVAAIIAALNVFWLTPNDPARRVFTADELARFTGAGAPTHSRRIYLAILGSVFDVTDGARHYGPTGNYRGAAGRDASKAFLTGNFSADQTDDLTNYKPDELASIFRWRNFFREHKTYKPIGKLVGRFFTPQGKPTEELLRVERVAGEAAAQTAEASKKTTECNVQWSGKGGKMVWCPNDKGYPRRIADDDSTSDRCLCAPSSTPTAILTLYEGCSPEAHKCRVADIVA